MRNKRALRIISGLGGVAAIVSIAPSSVFAQDGPDTQAYLDNIWVFIAGILVFFMQAGFALVEAGLTRAKNVVNIFAKNMADAIVGITAWFAVGWAFAFGPDGGDLIGSGQYFLSGADLLIPPEGGLSIATSFFFQVVEELVAPEDFEERYFHRPGRRASPGAARGRPLRRLPARRGAGAPPQAPGDGGGPRLRDRSGQRGAGAAQGAPGELCT